MRGQIGAACYGCNITYPLKYMRALGLRIFRIPASDVLADAPAIADAVLQMCGPSTTQLR